MGEHTFPPDGAGGGLAGEGPNAALDRLTAVARAKAAAATLATVELVDAVRELTPFTRCMSASARQWVAWQCGLTRAEAARVCTLADKLPGLPLLDAAFRAGRLSEGVVTTLVSVATPDNEAALLLYANCATGAQLQALVRDYRQLRRRPTDPASDDDTTQEAESDATWGWSDQGRFTGSFDLTPDDGATVEAALDAAWAALVPDEATIDNTPTDGEVRPEEHAKATHADALVALAEAALAAGAVDGAMPESHQIVLRRDLPLDGIDLGPVDSLFPTTLDGAGSIVRRLAEAMTCDARTITATMIAGFPVSTPTTSRTFTTTQRRALRARDRTCRYPGCGRARHLHAHHTRHWEHTGCTSVADGLLLCRQHHGLLHARGHTITLGVDHSVTVTRSDGTTLRAGPQPPPDIDEITRGRPPDPPPSTRETGTGEHMDFYARDTIISVWLTADDRAANDT